MPSFGTGMRKVRGDYLSAIFRLLERSRFSVASTSTRSMWTVLRRGLCSCKNTMSIPEVPKDLPALVKDRFQTAKEANALSFWPTEVAVLRLHGAPFQLRFCPALANKPKSEKPKGEKKAFDPFENPPAALLVTELPPSHFLVLNKFAIVPEHFILATKAFKQQTHLLEADDLAAAYACLKAWRATGKELFAFFVSLHPRRCEHVNSGWRRSYLGSPEYLECCGAELSLQFA